MTYQEIQGWFNDEKFYDFVVEDCKVPGDKAAIFVEVGCWRGKSTAYLAQKIRDSAKLIRLMAVDTWKGSANEPALIEEAKQFDLYREFMANMVGCDVESTVGVMRLESVRAATHFKPEAVSFCFLDGDHTEVGLLRDIEAWWPTIKVGGILAGHDWNTYESVRTAVKIWFCRPQIEGNVWWVRKTASL